MGSFFHPFRAKIASSQTCVVRPQQTEGPYFRDEKLERSDITSDPATGKLSPGVPLEIEFRVSRIEQDTCIPLQGALVDLWHCDALGVYSDVLDANFDTRGQKFLRGYQVTNSEGSVKFRTIYPGWYRGRTVHLHFKIRTSPSSGEGYEFTSQIYFDDSVSDEVFSKEPYSSRGSRGTKNHNDAIFISGGENLITGLALVDGVYTGIFDLALDTGTTDIGEKRNIKPDSYDLGQNYPNPFNSSTVIVFKVPISGFLTLKIYNGYGAEISTLANSIFHPGEYSVNWDAAGLPSGVYYYCLKSKSFTETKKLLLLK